MSDRDACAVCESPDVAGWFYFCREHDPAATRAAITEIFTRRMLEPSEEGLEHFVRTFAPQWMGGSERMMSSVLQAGSIARTLFELGRFFERNQFDGMAQEVLEAIPRPSPWEPAE